MRCPQRKQYYIRHARKTCMVAFATKGDLDGRNQLASVAGRCHALPRDSGGRHKIVTYRPRCDVVDGLFLSALLNTHSLLCDLTAFILTTVSLTSGDSFLWDRYSIDVYDAVVDPHAQYGATGGRVCHLCLVSNRRQYLQQIVDRSVHGEPGLLPGPVYERRLCHPRCGHDVADAILVSVGITVYGGAEHYQKKAVLRSLEVNSAGGDGDVGMSDHASTALNQSLLQAQSYGSNSSSTTAAMAQPLPSSGSSASVFVAVNTMEQ